MESDQKQKNVPSFKAETSLQLLKLEGAKVRSFAYNHFGLPDKREARSGCANTLCHRLPEPGGRACVSCRYEDAQMTSTIYWALHGQSADSWEKHIYSRSHLAREPETEDTGLG